MVIQSHRISNLIFYSKILIRIHSLYVFSERKNPVLVMVHSHLLLGIEPTAVLDSTKPDSRCPGQGSALTLCCYILYNVELRKNAEVRP